jgi:hypothetical protein
LLLAELNAWVSALRQVAPTEQLREQLRQELEAFTEALLAPDFSSSDFLLVSLQEGSIVLNFEFFDAAGVDALR